MGILKEETFVTFSEFEELNNSTDDLLEFIDGQTYALASPSFAHQKVSMRLGSHLDSFFNKKKCEVLAAPFDIKLTKEGLDTQLVIPDLVVICDKNGLNQKRYEGVPSLIVEILSPSNQHHDLIIKMNLYAKFGVKEYWIVNPMNKSISIFTLDETQHYIQDIVKSNGVIKSKLFSDLSVDVDNLFDF